MIRLAKLEDVPALCVLAREWMATGDYLGPRRALDVDTFAAHLRMALQSELVLGLVDERPEGLAAGLMCAVIPDIYSGGLVLMKLHWFAPNDGTGVRMLRKAQTWARERGIKEILFAAPSIPSGKILERLGFQIFEVMYHKGLKP